MAYKVSGSVSGYTGNGSGIPVDLHRSATGDRVATGVTSVGGLFTFVVEDDVTSYYVTARQDGAHTGRSDNGQAVDDGVPTQDALEKHYRAQIRQHFFGAAGDLPTAPPENFEPNFTPVYPFNSYNVVSPNLLRIDRISFRVDADIVVYAYHYVNTSGSKGLAISHEGHSYFNLPDHATHIQNLLNLGWNVVLVQMPTIFSPTHPPDDPNPLSVVGHQDWCPAREATDPGYLRVFLLPTIYGKAHLKEAYGYDRFVMVGLSGGGWTTNVVAAIDEEIEASWCVSGSLPWDLRSHLGRGDYEQHARAGFTSIGGTTTQRPFFQYLPEEYRDLYAMGATAGRLARQVYIENEDPAYFASVGLHTEIDAAIGACDARVSGTVAVSYDTTQTEHKISTFTANVIDSDLESRDIIVTGPSGADVLDPVIPNTIVKYRGDSMTAGQLTDMSGNGNHAIQATAENQGSVAVDPYLGHPAIRLVAGGAGDDFYRCNTVLVGGGAPPAYANYTMLAVYQIDDGNASQIILTGTNSAGDAQSGPNMFNLGNAGGTLWWNVAPTGQATYVLSSKRWVWTLGIHTPTERRLYVNGVLRATSAIASSCGAIAKIGVGKSNDASPFWPMTGRIAELRIAGHEVTSAQIAAIRAYVRARYGL